MTWYGLKQIRHVAATILRNVRLEKGADIQVGSRKEQTSKFINKRAGLDTVFTWKLCVTMHRRGQLTIVITHSNYQINGPVWQRSHSQPQIRRLEFGGLCITLMQRLISVSVILKPVRRRWRGAFGQNKFKPTSIQSSRTLKPTASNISVSLLFRLSRVAWLLGSWKPGNVNTSEPCGPVLSMTESSVGYAV